MIFEDKVFTLRFLRSSFTYLFKFEGESSNGDIHCTCAFKEGYAIVLRIVSDFIGDSSTLSSALSYFSFIKQVCKSKMIKVRSLVTTIDSALKLKL